MSGATSLVDGLPARVVDHDGDRWPWLVGRPEAVVHPESTEEVAATLRWAAAHDVGVAVVASGRRFEGARTMDGPFLVLCTDRVVGIDIYEPADLTITVKAGTPLPTLTATLAAERQWLPYDPPFVDDRTVGGLVATGESGPLWMGYGELRNHVLGATLVTGDGRVLRLGGRVVKNVAGFDLLKVVVGSRGRLGVITSVCLRTFPVPLADRVLTVRGATAADLVAVARSVGTAPLLPVSSVLVEPAPAHPAGAALLVRLHGAEPTVEADRKTLERHCGVAFERTGGTDASLSAVRDHAAHSDTTLSLSIRPSQLGDALSVVSEVLGGVSLAADTYKATVRVALEAIDPEAVDRVRARIESLGGSLSVRTTRKNLNALGLGSRPSPAVVELTRRLGEVFDPQGVLWPSKP